MRPGDVFGTHGVAEWGPWFCLAVLDHCAEIRTFIEVKGDEAFDRFQTKIREWWTTYRHTAADDGCVLALFGILDQFDVIAFMKAKSYLPERAEAAENLRADDGVGLRGALERIADSLGRTRTK